MSISIPETISANELASKMGWSARRLKAFARQIGACRVLGNRVVLIQEDVDAILEATRPPPQASQARGLPTSSGYEQLLKLRARK